MAAMESLSSCGPQAYCQSPPPMAQAPKPMGVRCRSELPSWRVVPRTLSGRVVLRMRKSYLVWMRGSGPAESWNAMAGGGEKNDIDPLDERIQIVDMDETFQTIEPRRPRPRCLLQTQTANDRES